MAETIGDLELVISGRFDELEKALHQTQTQVGTTFASIADNVGRVMLGVGAAITGAFGLAVKSAVEFENNLSKLKTLGQDMTGVEDIIKKIATTWGQDLNTVAQTFYGLGSSGFDMATQGMEIMTAAAKGATGGIAGIDEAAKLLTGTMNAWGLEASDSEKVMGILVTAVKNGETTIGEISAAMGKLAPVASSMGVSIEEIAAGLVGVTLASNNTSEGMTKMLAAMNAMIAPSKEAQEIYAAIGIQIDAQTLSEKGFIETLNYVVGAIKEKNNALYAHKDALAQQIESMESAGKLNAAQKEQLGELKEEYESLGGIQRDWRTTLTQALGSTEALNAAMAITQDATGKVKITLEDTANAQKNLNDMSDAFVEKNPAIAFARLKAELSILSVEIGRTLLPAFVSIVDVLKWVVSGITEFRNEFPLLSTVLISVVAAFGALSLSIGTVMFAVKPFVPIVKFLIGANGLAGVATAAQGAGAAMTAAGTATTAAGASIAAVTAPIWLVVAAATAAAIAIGAVVKSFFEWRNAVQQQQESQARLGAQTEQWAQQLEALGIKVDRLKLAEMDLDKQREYLNDLNTQRHIEQRKNLEDTTDATETSSERFLRMFTANNAELDVITSETQALLSRLDPGHRESPSILDMTAESLFGSGGLISLYEEAVKYIGDILGGLRTMLSDVWAGVREVFGFGGGTPTAFSRGGPLERGQEYKVGERGPETYISGSHATMVGLQGQEEGISPSTGYILGDALTKRIFSALPDPRDETPFDYEWEGEHILKSMEDAGVPDTMKKAKALFGARRNLIVQLQHFGWRAAGGPVKAGEAYMVGEKGPELVVPREDGNMLPNSALGGVNVNITMNGTIVREHADVGRIADALGQRLRGSLAAVGVM